VRWVEGMQSSDGGWGAFDADNTRALVRELPFCDFGEVIDPPSADVTAHASRCSPRSARRRPEPRARRALADRRAGARRLVVRALGRQPRLRHRRGRAGADRGRVPPAHERIRRAVRWLEEHQNEDGGWGEDARSYDDPAWIGRGESTASQTAWALLALHAAGERSDGARAAASTGWSTRSAPTAAGTSRSTPAPASRRTSTSTTTSTGSCSRSWRSGAAAARAVRAPDRGQPRRPARQPL
jgi:squalene-hopene/tetraprenyl-beta-curcumene cyclase